MRVAHHEPTTTPYTAHRAPTLNPIHNHNESEEGQLDTNTYHNP